MTQLAEDVDANVDAGQGSPAATSVAAMVMLALAVAGQSLLCPQRVALCWALTAKTRHVTARETIWPLIPVVGVDVSAVGGIPTKLGMPGLLI